MNSILEKDLEEGKSYLYYNKDVYPLWLIVFIDYGWKPEVRFDISGHGFYGHRAIQDGDFFYQLPPFPA